MPVTAFQGLQNQPGPLAGTGDVLSQLIHQYQKNQAIRQANSQRQAAQNQIGGFMGQMRGQDVSGMTQSDIMRMILSSGTTSPQALATLTQLAGQMPQAGAGQRVLGPGQNLYDQGGKLITEGPAPTQSLPEVVRLLKYMEGMNPDSPQYKQLEARVGKLTSPASQSTPELQRLQNYAAKLPEGDPRRAQVEALIQKKIAPPTGMELTVGPDGQTTFRTGVKGGNLTRGTQTAIEKELNDTGKGLHRLFQIENSFDPEYLTYGTQWGSKWSAFKDKAGLGLTQDERANLNKYTEFTTNTLSNLNRYIKEITGAQMSEKEADRLMKAMPNLGDSPIQFKTKMDTVTGQLRSASARLHFVKKHGLSIEDVPVENMPKIMNRRSNEIGAALEKQYPGLEVNEIKERIRTQIAQEFGLVE